MPTTGIASKTSRDDPLAGLADPCARDWFNKAFPQGPTPAQRMAWPVVAADENLLLVAPTGTGKTLAAFLGILDRLFVEEAAGTLEPGLRVVYVSPLRSLGYDIERNLAAPLAAIRRGRERSDRPISVAVRSGDTTPHHRRKQRLSPPHLLITTPESLALLLSQSSWRPHWSSLTHIIIDEIHALVPTKRGADLAISIERLSARATREPVRIGLSATCGPTRPVARFLVGSGGACRILEAPPPPDAPSLEIEVASLLKSDEAPHRGLTYRRLLKRLGEEAGRNRTTVVFANTRAFCEKITHDLRRTLRDDPAAVAAHHSALDAGRRREVESALKEGSLRAVVTSTSLELGVDIGTADLSVQVGLPGGVARLLQRVGRSGHHVGAASRGLILAATPAELAGAVVTAAEAREGRVEPTRFIQAPLDVLCQQLVGMAVEEEWSCDAAYELIRRSSPMESLTRADFDACLAFLAGELASPAGACEPEPGATPRFTSPRIWRRGGYFGVRNGRVARWYRSNVGTITSEESVRVLIDGREVGTLEGAYAERLAPGDRFLLDGTALEFQRLDGLIVHARPTGGEPGLPRWSSDRQSLSAPLAAALAEFRVEAARQLADGPDALREWLCGDHDLDPEAAALLSSLFEAQERLSESPGPDLLLVEEWADEQGWTYAFHAPLSRAACEALGQATAARLGRSFGRDLTLSVADLGWTVRLQEGARLQQSDLSPLLDSSRLAEDVLEGLERGELLARRFRHVAATGLMVLRNPEGGRRKVGGLLWVRSRLYPLVRAACPDHPLLRETRREVMNEFLDVPTAADWLARGPTVRFRQLDGPSPFAAAWLAAGSDAIGESLRFESPAEALRRLHARLTAGARGAGDH